MAEVTMQCINCSHKNFHIVKKDSILFIKCERCKFNFEAKKIENDLGTELEFITEKYQPEGFDPWNPRPILFIGEKDSKVPLF